MDQELESQFEKLKLKHAWEAYKGIAEDRKMMARLSVGEVLGAILAEELNMRRRMRQKMLMRTARIPIPAGLKDVSHDDERGQDFVRTMARLKSMEWIGSGENLCIYGAAGTGKSWIASALAREAVRRDMPVQFCNASDLCAELIEKKEAGRKSYRNARSALMRRKRMVIDDFCLTPPGEVEQSVLFDILNDRSGTRSTLVTSQKDRNLWIEDMKVTPMAEAIAERICANAWSITLQGRSRRRAAG